MKKVLLLGFILAILLLAFPQGVMAAGDPTAEVTASIQSIADLNYSQNNCKCQPGYLCMRSYSPPDSSAGIHEDSPVY